MPTPESIGQAIQNLIRDHVVEHGDYPVGIENYTEVRHDHGLLIFTFEDGSRIRCIIEKVWDPIVTPPVVTPPVTEPPVVGEPPVEEDIPPSGEEPVGEVPSDEEPPVEEEPPTGEPPVGEVPSDEPPIEEGQEQP